MSLLKIVPRCSLTMMLLKIKQFLNLQKNTVHQVQFNLLRLNLTMLHETRPFKTQNKTFSFFSRPNVSSWSILRRNVPDLWHWGHELCRSGSGGPDWSDGLRLPANDKVHLPQVWIIGRNWKTRRPLHFASQHFQWKNLHFPLVLDADPRLPDLTGGPVPRHDHRLVQRALLLAANSLPTRQGRIHRADHGEVGRRRLVPPLSARPKHWPSDIQRCNVRAGQKVGLQKQRHVRRLNTLLSIWIYRGAAVIQDDVLKMAMTIACETLCLYNKCLCRVQTANILKLVSTFAKENFHSYFFHKSISDMCKFGCSWRRLHDHFRFSNLN